MSKQLNVLKKGANLFKFYSFAERISMVNLDIFRASAHVDKVQAPLDVNETYFLRELEFLKLSADASFRHLFYVIRPWSVSLPMIILHLKGIIKAILKFLDQAKPELIPAVFSLLGILSRDLRSEFYPFFDIILQCFIAKIDEWKNEPEQLEALFTTIARQFKYLERYLIKDIKKVFILYKDFFVTKKEHVRQFAAESFAYLLRKLNSSKFNEMIDFMISHIPAPSQTPEMETKRRELADGVGFLLFYVVQGIKLKFTTSSFELVPLIFSKLSTRSKPDEAMQVDDENQENEAMPSLNMTIPSQTHNNQNQSIDTRFLILFRFIQSTRKHFKNNDCSLLWTSLSRLVESILADEMPLSETDFQSIGYAFSLAAEWLDGRHLPKMSPEHQSSLLESGVDLLSLVQNKMDLISASPVPPVPQGHAVTQETLERIAVDFSVRLFSLMSNEHSTTATAIARKQGRPSLDRLFVLLKSHPGIAYRFTLQLQDTSLFKHSILPHTLQFIETQLKRLNSSNSSNSTNSTKSSNSSNSKNTTNTSSNIHPTAEEAMSFAFRLAQDLDWGSMIGAAHINIASRTLLMPSDRLASLCHETVVHYLSKKSKSDMPLSTLWLAVKTLGFLQIVSDESLEEFASSLFDLLKAIQKNASINNNTQNVLIGAILSTVCQLSRSAGAKHESVSVSLLKRALKYSLKLPIASLGSNWHMIQGLADLIELGLSEPYGNAMRYHEAKMQLRAEKPALKALIDHLVPLTSHSNVATRKSSWNLLKAIALVDDDIPLHLNLVKLCQELVNIKFDPLQHKDISSRFTDVVDTALQPAAQPSDRALAMRFLIGVFYIQLTPLWPPAIKSLNRLQEIDQKSFWSVVLPMIINVQSHVGSSGSPSTITASNAMDVDPESHKETDSMEGHSLQPNSELYLSRESDDSISSMFEETVTESFRFTGTSSFSDSLWASMIHAARSLAPTSPTASSLFDQFLLLIETHFPHLDDPARMHVFSQNSKQDENKAAKPNDLSMADAETDDDLEDMPRLLPDPETSKQSRAAIGEVRRYLLHFLKFMGTYKNAIGVKKAPQLFEILSKLIAIANTDIQLATLQCLCLFKDIEYIIPYKAQLETLIQDNRVRIPFTEFPLSAGKSPIQAHHREPLIPLISRILYPKLTLTRFDPGRRAAVLSYLAQCSTPELETIFQLSLGPLRATIQPCLDQVAQMVIKNPTPGKSKRKEVAALDVASIEKPAGWTLGQLIGGARMINDMINAMAAAIHFYLPTLLCLSLWFLHHGQGLYLELSETDDRSQPGQLRKLATRNITAIMSFFDGYQYGPYQSEIIRLLKVEGEILLPITPIPHNAPFIQWCETISGRPKLVPFISPFIHYLLLMLKAQIIDFEARSVLFTIVENLLRIRDAAPEEPTISSSSKYNPGQIISGLTPKQRAKMDHEELHAHDVQFELAKEYRKQADVLLPHSNDLLDAMQIRLFSDYDIKKRISFRELNILDKLAPYATTSSHADKLASLILPLTKQKTVFADMRLRILSLFSELVPLLTDALSHLENVLRLFTDMKDAPCRAQLVRIFNQLGKLDPDLSQIVDLVASLNSMNPNRIDEPDYERRMSAYTKINEELVHTLPERSMSFIIANYLSFVPNDDLSIRNNAIFGLTLIIKRIAAQIDGETGEPRPGPNTLPLTFVTQMIMGEAKRQLNSSIELVRREFLGVMSIVIKNLPFQYADLTPALGTDDDSNYFLLVHHIQTYRRIRILTKLAEWVRQGKFNTTNLVQIFFPVLKQLLLTATLKQHAVVDACIDAIAAITSRLEWKPFYSIIQTCLRGMTVNKTIQNQWIKLLCTVLDTFHFDISKVYDDVVAETKPKPKRFTVTSEHAQFDEEAYEKQMEADAKAKNEEASDSSSSDDESSSSSSSSEDEGDDGVPSNEVDSHAEGSSKDPKEEVSTDDESEHDLVAEENEEVDVDPVSGLTAPDLLQRQIQRIVIRSLLPTLVRLSKTEEKDDKSTMRSNVVVCAVRLLSQMPDAMSHVHISYMVIEVSNQLSSRAFVNRLSANVTIQEILKILGPKKFLFILDILVGQLRRGFQLHILCSVVHTLLKALQPLVKPGEIDEGLHMLNKVFFEELLGKVAEQKKVKQIVNATAEAGKTYAFDSIGIVAQLIDFQTSARTFIDPFIDVILATTDVKLLKKMKQALDQISVGFRSNPSASTESICIFVYQLVDQYSHAKTVEKEAAQSDMERTWVVEANPYKQGTYAAAAQVTGKETNNDHVIVAYALQFLFSLMKSSRLNPKDSRHLALLDPYVPILARNLRSRKDDVLIVSLRCLTSLTKYPLPQIEGRSGMLAEATIHLLQKANIQSELLKMCFKSLARILSSSKANVKIADGLWQIVIGYVREVLETDTPQHGLDLFKAMVGKRILMPEMYDTMKRVNELLVHTHTTSVREYCEQIIATFILSYPLKPKRLDQQFEFVMANLTFNESGGRLAILHLLKTLFVRLPEQVLNDRVTYFFLPLVAQMVNDDFPENRAAAASAIETLFSRVTKVKSEELFQMALTWYEDDAGKVSLQRAAAQLIILFAGKMGGESFSPFVLRLIPTFVSRIEQAFARNSFDDDDEEYETLVHVSDDQWQGLYFTLLAVEKTLALVPSLVLKNSLISLWKLIASPQLLSFPHPWVKLVCARLLGTYFGARKEHMPIQLNKKQKKSSQNRPSSAASPPSSDDWIAEPRRLFSVAKLFCDMLPAADLSEELGTQVVKNLYWLVLQLQAFPELTPLSQIQASRIAVDDQIEEADEAMQDDEPGSDVDDNRMQVDADGSDSGNGFENGDSSQGESKKPLETATETAETREMAKDFGGVPAVSWIFRRLSYMSKTLSRLGKSCVFKMFAAAAMAMEANEVKRYLVFMLFPLFRANEAILARQAAAARNPDRQVPETTESQEFAELVQQVAELLKKKVGTTAYYEVHEIVRARVLEVRQKRKSDLAVESVVNPAKAALRKAARNEQAKRSKKRKIEAHTSIRTTNRLKVRKTQE
jgi:hypothetical protein